MSELNSFGWTSSGSGGGGGGNAVILLGVGTGSSYRCGNGNSANGNGSTVSGGLNNTASCGYSVVGGGQANTASNYSSTVSGGLNNTASGGYSVVGGGQANTASGYCSTVSGGYGNTASGRYSIIGGGFQNTASDYCSTVGGGNNNTINPFATCSGYYICGNVIGGGSNNTINSNSAFYSNAGGVTIGGGANNTTNSNYFGFNTIGGGQCNSVFNDGTTISGGRQNTASSDYSTVVGGICNTSSGAWSVSGGICNIASGNGSAVLGGFNNVASGCYSGAFGFNLTASCNYTFYTNNHCACGSLYTSAISSGCGVCVTTGGQLVGYTPPPPSISYGLYAQTALGTNITATIVETSLVGAGVGTLSVPANAFQVGDSFTVKMCGLLSCANGETIHIRIKSNGILIIDTGVFQMKASTNKYFELILDFTVTKLGIAGVAELFANGQYSYNQDANASLEGNNFASISNTTFNTTITNTLTITAQWGSNNASNSIQSQNFVLQKVY